MQYYENLLKNEKSPEERAKIQALIDTAKDLIKVWKKHKKDQQRQRYFDNFKKIVKEW